MNAEVVKTKHLTFSMMPLRKGHKTQRWSVWNHHYGEQLGIIVYYPPWRHYCFETGQAVYSLSCLQDIVIFLERINRKNERLPEPG